MIILFVLFDETFGADCEGCTVHFRRFLSTLYIFVKFVTQFNKPALQLGQIYHLRGPGGGGGGGGGKKSNIKKERTPNIKRGGMLIGNYKLNL